MSLVVSVVRTRIPASSVMSTRIPPNLLPSCLPVFLQTFFRHAYPYSSKPSSVMPTRIPSKLLPSCLPVFLQTLPSSPTILTLLIHLSTSHLRCYIMPLKNILNTPPPTYHLSPILITRFICTSYPSHTNLSHIHTLSMHTFLHFPYSPLYPSNTPLNIPRVLTSLLSSPTHIPMTDLHISLSISPWFTFTPLCSSPGPYPTHPSSPAHRLPVSGCLLITPYVKSVLHWYISVSSFADTTPLWGSIMDRVITVNRNVNPVGCWCYHGYNILSSLSQVEQIYRWAEYPFILEC